MPMVVYVKNLAAERLGTVSDNELIASFLNDGMLVVEVDYRKDARAHGADMYVDVLYPYRVFGANRGIDPEKPFFGPLTDEFIRWDEERIATCDKFVARRNTETIEYTIDPLWVYVIPEGFAVDRYVEMSTIQSAKRTVVHRMGLIHPALPARPVPAVLEISSSWLGRWCWWKSSVIGSSLGVTSASFCSASMPTTRVCRRCCPTAGPRPTPRRFSPIGPKNPEIKRPAPAAIEPIVAPAPNSPFAPYPPTHPPWTGRTLTRQSQFIGHQLGPLSRGMEDGAVASRACMGRPSGLAPWTPPLWSWRNPKRRGAPAKSSRWPSPGHGRVGRGNVPFAEITGRVWAIPPRPLSAAGEALFDSAFWRWYTLWRTLRRCAVGENSCQ